MSALHKNIPWMHSRGMPLWAVQDKSDSETLWAFTDLFMSEPELMNAVDDSRAVMWVCREAAVLFTQLHDGPVGYWFEHPHDDFLGEVQMFVEWIKQAYEQDTALYDVEWFNQKHWSMLGKETLMDLLARYKHLAPPSIADRVNGSFWDHLKERLNGQSKES